MSRSAFHGTPCLVPVQIRPEAEAERRGFITRLSTLAAAVSSDPALAEGDRVTLSFKRPSDAELVHAPGQVTSLLPEGGLWRGRPAALVEFDAAVELEEAGPQLDRFQRSADPNLVDPVPDPLRLEARSPVPALGSALRKGGLGHRRRSGRMPGPGGGDDDHQDDLTPLQREAVSGEAPELRARPLEDAFFDDESTAPPARGFGHEDDDATMPPHDGQEGPTTLGFSELFAIDDATVPPRTPTNPNLDDDFFAQFGGGGDVPAYSLPPGAMDATGGHPLFPGDGLPGELPDDAIGPASTPGARRPQRRDDEHTAPAPGRPWSLVDSQAVPPVQNSGGMRSRQPAPKPDPEPRDGRPPWEASHEDRSLVSFLPRNARIASTIDVHFWARGRRHGAVADNFSLEGLFLNYDDTPPVRGAIVRVEFPLEGDDESVPVRFNAEVRWHRSDRPGAGLPDGFGVQILTFETPKDRARYAELLDAILALGPASEPAEHGFSWGSPGGGSRS